MEHTDHLMALARDGAAFAEASAAAGLAAPVNSCPGWSVADLVWHLTEVHHFWRTIVGERRETWEGLVRPERPSDGVLLDEYRLGFNDTLSVLSDADPEQANWTWSSDHTAGFVMRRMAQETAVHRWDAEAAAEHDYAIDADLASDGVDEFLAHMLHDAIADAPELGGTVHLHCTDVPGEWMVRPTAGGGLNVIREHAKGDAAMRGTASDLLLVLWRRRDLSVLEVLGDAAVAERFVAHTSLE